MEILIGPILGFEDGDYYTCLVSTTEDKPLKWHFGGHEVDFEPIAKVSSGQVWRAEVHRSKLVPDATGNVPYSVRLDSQPIANAKKDAQWSFHVLGAGEKPRIAYASCNGFHDPDEAGGRWTDLTTFKPLAMWERFADLHRKEPFSLLLMGGDQLYCDGVLRGETPNLHWLQKWHEDYDKPENDKKTTVTPDQRASVAEFYDRQYRLSWVGKKSRGFFGAMIDMMASIPSVMMWDDHDIFDGWGSYPSGIEQRPVFQAVFAEARRHFEIYQVRSLKNRSLLTRDGSSYSLGFRFGNYTILAMDNRTERTPTQIISDANWKNTLVPWLNSRSPGKSDHLILLSAVPVVYRRFDVTSDILKAIPGHQEPEDDLIDHWSHKWHEGERSKLVQHLFRIVEEKAFRTACILSGDVHVGALGVLHHKKTGRKIPQIISSAIVNREPSWLQWVGLVAASTDDDFDIPATDIRVTMENPCRAIPNTFVPVTL